MPSTFTNFINKVCSGVNGCETYYTFRELENSHGPNQRFNILKKFQQK